jgi:hypothetical protein
MNDSALSAQQRRAVRQLHAVADELQEMSARTGRSPAGDATKQAAERVRSAASWLEQREPADVVREAREFARRHPGTVLASAAVAGLAVRRRPCMLLAGVVAVAVAARRLSRGATRPDSRQKPPGEPAAVIPAPPDPDWTSIPGHPDAPGAATGSAPYYPASGVPGPGVAGPAGPEPHQPEEQP